MARYYYYLANYHHRHRHLKRLKRVLIGFIVIVILVVSSVAADILFSHSHHSSPLSQPSTIIQQAPITVIRSKYFQFQAPTGWEEVGGAGNNGEYSYRNIDNTQIKQEIDIYINSQPSPFVAEYIDPLTVKADGGLSAGEVSDHCRHGAPANSKDASLTMTYQSVTFNCHVDGTDYTVLAGLKGGTPLLRLHRPNGSTADYIIVYRDLTAYPGPGQLSQILNSFQPH